MNKLHTALGLLVAGAIVLTLSAQDGAGGHGQRSVNPAVVVGTFDSRAVAIAYIRSETRSEELRALHAELARAKAAGDAERVAELEALGPALQKRAHEQGFGSAPVDDIIAQIEDRLPGIADAAGVDVIVSKWALTYRRPHAKLVDVTDEIAAAFHPDAETLEIIRDVLKTEPIPLDQLDHDH
jgi:hypothetical protein